MNKTRDSVKIYFCLPDSDQFNSLEDFIDNLVEKSKENTSADEDSKWGGFLGKSYLVDALETKFNNEDYEKYVVPETGILGGIKTSVEDAVMRAKKILSNKQYPLRIFIYPWFPKETEAVFRGTMGTAFWANTFHLYIDTNNFSTESLKDTVVHEYNHAMYFNHHSPFEQTILNAIIMEGLAENFRDEINGKNPSPWATVIKEKEVESHLEKIENDLDSHAEYGDLYKKIFYGIGEHRRWLGYSLGYRIVNSFMSLHPDVKWGDLIKLESTKFLQEPVHENIET
jgi:hypothetical protein